MPIRSTTAAPALHPPVPPFPCTRTGAPGPRTPPRRRAPGPAVVALAPALVVAVMGLWGIRRGGSLWQDEYISQEMAHRGLGDLWATLGRADAVHGAYYLLLHLVFGLWGGGPIALRLPSVAAMAAAAAGVAALGHRLAGPRAGTAAGGVFALLPMVQRYAQEGRSYALVTALVVWATWALPDIAAGAKSNRRRAVYGLLMATACLFHEFAVLAAVAHGTTFLLLRADRRVIRQWSVTLIPSFVVLLPLVVLSSRQSRQVEWITVGAGALGGFSVIASVSVTAGLLISRGGLRWERNGSRERGIMHAFCIPLAIVPPALLLAVSTVQPLYSDRYVLYDTVGMSVLLGALLEKTWRFRPWRPVVASALALTAVFLVAVVGARLRTPESRSDDVVAIGKEVTALSRPGDGLLFLPASRRIWVAPPVVAAAGLRDLALAVGPRASRTLYGRELPTGRVRENLAGAARVILVGEPGRLRFERSPQDRAKTQALARYFTPCATYRLGAAHLTVYARPGVC